jgi:hypothetical protein
MSDRPTTAEQFAEFFAALMAESPPLDLTQTNNGPMSLDDLAAAFTKETQQ